MNDMDIRKDIEAGLLDWLEFHPNSPSKIIARRRDPGRLSHEDVLGMRMARAMQDQGLISIITRRKGREIIYVAERVS